MAAGDDFAAVLLAAQEGAEWAFAAIYGQINPRLVRYFAARIPGQADDLAADVWLNVATGLHSFCGDERQFRSWLFTIAHRRLVDHWRRARTEDLTDPAELAGFAQLDGLNDPATLVVDALAAREAARRIAAVLSRDQAEVVLLRLLAGLDVDEVAAILDKRPGTIRVLQHRALKSLAREFSLETVGGRWGVTI